MKIEELREKTETHALQLKSKYESLVVKDDKSFKAMASFEKRAKESIKKIKAHMDPVVKEANSTHKKLTATRTRMLAPYVEIAENARAKCIEYTEGSDTEETVERAREVWTATITDLPSFLSSVVAGEYPLPALTSKKVADLAKLLELDKYGAVMKEKASVKGVKFERSMR